MFFCNMIHPPPPQGQGNIEQESSSVKFEMSALVMEKEQAVKVSV